MDRFGTFKKGRTVAPILLGTPRDRRIGGLLHSDVEVPFLRIRESTNPIKL